MKYLLIYLISLLLVMLNTPYIQGEQRPNLSYRSDEERIADLASDDVRWNATRAFYWFFRHRAPVQLLEEALNSTDYQQRQMAADLLRRIDGYQLSDRLLEVIVEGLQDDLYPRDPVRGTRTPPLNATFGVKFLLKHSEEAKKYLIAGLYSKDLQQRFLCAYIVGMNGIKDELSAVASILIPHLRDNDIRQDACMACCALYHIGEDVRPYLLKAIPNADSQQEKTIHLILTDLEHPPGTSEELAKRRHMQSITTMVYDPALHYKVLEIDFPFLKEKPRQSSKEMNGDVMIKGNR